MCGDGDREATVRRLLPLVKKIARRVKRVVPSADYDDLVGDGSVGLIRAVDSFDPSRGPTIETYARHLISGAILNGMRRMDPVPERARRAVREMQNRRYAIAMETGETPTLTRTLAGNPSAARAAVAVYRGQPLSLDATLPPGESLRLDWGGDPAAIVAENGERDALRAEIGRLPGRQRDLVRLHYFAERPLREIGERMMVSAQRASQLHLAALKRLRKNVVAPS
ncbi:MAG: sigma-70 family RNA polymerase sigma factor [Vulcanimicrobiaceae bacterium]